MATLQKLRTKIKSLLLSICVILIALILGFSFLIALAILTPIAFFGLLFTATAISLASRLRSHVAMRLPSVIPIRQALYKLTAGIAPIKRRTILMD